MPSATPDWTKGPAKFLAAGTLGGAAAVGLVWALTSHGTPAPTQPTPPPAIIAPQPITNQPQHNTSTQPTTPPPAAPPTLPTSSPPSQPTPSASSPAATPAATPSQPAGPAPAPSAAPAATPSPAPAPTPAPTSTIARKLNLNTASAAELESLPGIGPALAKRILDHRSQKGPFRRIEDLDAVSGIGPKTLERLRPFITIE